MEEKTVYPDKAKNKSKNNGAKHKTRLILSAFLLGGVLLVLLIYLYPTPSKPEVDLSGLKTIKIENAWVVFTPDSPSMSTYELEMIDGALVGKHMYTTAQSQAFIENVEVPADAVTAFLSTLEQIEPVSVDYPPYLGDIEPYPALEMSFVTDHGKILMYMMLPGAGPSRWGAIMRGGYYVIPSTIPMDALKNIGEYLQGGTIGESGD